MQTKHQESEPIGRLREIAGRLRDGLAPVDKWVRTSAREHPLLALGGAIGIGYLVGRLCRGLTEA